MSRKCDSYCFWYPKASFENPQYDYKNYGEYNVKIAEPREHRCIESGKLIKSHRMCSKYKTQNT